MIIGITGTLGAGKGTVVEYLIKTRGFKHYSSSGFVKEEVVQLGLPLNRDTISQTARDLRAQHGPGYIVASNFSRAEQDRGDAVLEAIQTLGEAQEIKKRGGILWGVDADIKTRYERITKRGSEKDNVSFDKFVAQEGIELHAKDPSDVGQQNIAGVMAIADGVIYNNGTQEELFAQVEEALKKASK